MFVNQYTVVFRITTFHLTVKQLMNQVYALSWSRNKHRMDSKMNRVERQLMFTPLDFASVYNSFVCIFPAVNAC